MPPVPGPVPSAPLRRAHGRAAASPDAYGVLVGAIRQGRPADGHEPHFMIELDAGGLYRVAVNIRSADGDDILALFDPHFSEPTKRDLPTLAAGTPGFRPLSTGPGGQGLDYLRDGLFPLDAMMPLPAEGDDFSSLDVDFASLCSRAAADPGAVAIVFGQHFHDAGADEVFGFSPEQGLHDIHMMQGNSGRYARENRINGDGAMFVRFSDESTTAFFARFSTQSIAT